MSASANLLEAIPGSAALLASDATIVAVNGEWRSITVGNGGDARLCGVGANYLAASDGADATVRGVTDVLGGSLDRYTSDYPCHSPTERRWFRLTVTPYAGGMGLVIHSDVTDHYERLSTVLDATNSSCVEFDDDDTPRFDSDEWFEKPTQRIARLNGAVEVVIAQAKTTMARQAAAVDETSHVVAVPSPRGGMVRVVAVGGAEV